MTTSEEDRDIQDQPDDDETDDVPAGDLADAQAQADAGPAQGPPSPEELEALRKAAAESDELRDKWLRAKADYVNLQQRTRREVAAAAAQGMIRLATDLLPVLDAFDRALDAADASQDANQLIDGVRLVHQAFHDALVRHGLERIPAQGEVFNPNLHEAMVVHPTLDAPDGTVIEELRSGYRLGNRVVRATQVAVARNPEPEPPTGSQEQHDPDPED